MVYDPKRFSHAEVCFPLISIALYYFYGSGPVFVALAGICHLWRLCFFTYFVVKIGLIALLFLQDIAFYAIPLLSLVVLVLQSNVRFVRFSIDRAGFSIGFDWKREHAHQAVTTANKESCVWMKLSVSVLWCALHCQHTGFL